MQGDAYNYIGKNAGHSKQWCRVDSTNNTKSFAWMRKDECKNKGARYQAPEEGFELSALVYAPIGLKEKHLQEYLEDNDVDTCLWGKGQAMTVSDLSAELMKGEASLETKGNGVVDRVINMVVLHLVHSVTGKILVQTERRCLDGSKDLCKRLPHQKARPDENYFSSAWRLLQRQLKAEESHIILDADSVQQTEVEEKGSSAYPGLRTIFRNFIITATLSRGGSLSLL